MASAREVSKAYDDEQASRPELPLDLVVDLDTLPILTTAPNIHSYNQAPIEDSLILRQASESDSTPLLDAETIERQPLNIIHQLIAQQSKVSADFVDKLVAFHLGHLSLSVEDVTEYFFQLDRRFHDFARHSLDYLTLTKNDQAALLIANAPLYYHLHLTRYINSCDGLDQVSSLLGTSLPEDLIDCDKFLTISFRYFASAMRLFKDPIWLDQYEYGCSQLNTKEALEVDKVAACLLFNFRNGIFDEPEKIARLYVKQLEIQCNANKSQMEKLNAVVLGLKAQISRYCHGATITMIGITFRDSTDVTIDFMPSANYNNEEEVFWMERQLTRCQQASLSHCDLETTDISQAEFIQNLRTRCEIMLKEHHEYRQLCSTNDSSLQDVLSEVETNISQCVTFLLACMARNGTACLQDHQNSKQRHKFRPTLNDGPFEGWLNRYPQVISGKLSVLVQLLILWNTNRTSIECDTLLGRLTSIRDRYRAYFVHELATMLLPTNAAAAAISTTSSENLAKNALDQLLQIIADDKKQ